GETDQKRCPRRLRLAHQRTFFLLQWNVRRGVVMRNAPFAIALSDEHSEARRSGDRLTILHSRKFIKSGDEDSIVAKHNRSSFTDSICVTGGRTKIFGDGLRSFRDNGAYGAEQDCVGCVELYQCVAVIGTICCRPPIDEPVCLLCRAREGPR